MPTASENSTQRSGAISSEPPTDTTSPQSVVTTSTRAASLTLPWLISPLPPSRSSAMRSQLLTAESVSSPTVTTSVSRPYSVWSISRVAMISMSSAERRVSRIAGA